MSDYQGNIIIKNPATPTGPTATGRAPGVWKLSDVAYWVKQGVWPNPAILPDPSFPNVSLLLATTALSNASNNLFVDSSGAFTPLSSTGNMAQGSFTPYGSSWSNFFDGNADYLSIPYSSAFNMTGDFTVECWINCANLPTSIGTGPQLYERIFSFGTYNAANSFGVEINSTVTNLRKFLAWYNGTSYDISGNNAVSSGVWTHLAFVRSGTTITLYINGVATGFPITGASAAVNTSQPFYIASLQSFETDTNACFSGYISNFRVVKGAAIYTSNFTPPTAPLTAISGTSLLTCQSNRFLDASTNNFTVTPNGNTLVTEYGPFSPAYPGVNYNQNDIANWSGYFDGTGDLLTTPTSSALGLTSDWTVETWVYPTSYAAGANAFFDNRAAGVGCGLYYSLTSFTGGPGAVGYATNSALVAVSSIAIPLFAWTHIAFTRSGNTITCYINGTSNFTYTDTRTFASTANYVLGNSVHPPQGYMAGYRVVRGTAVYTSNFTPPAAPLTAVSGTSLLTLQNAAFTDSSTNNLALTVSGNPTVTGNSPLNPLGYWSNYFNGTSSRMTVADNAAFGFGTGNFTVEFWLNYTGGNGYKFFFVNPGSSGNYVGYGLQTGTLTPWVWNAGDVLVASSNITPNTWQHHALVRNGSTLTIYLNGVAIGSTTWTVDLGASRPFYIGWNSSNDSQTTAGYFSNFRVVKGTAVYTSNFTPPTSPLTAISGTSLLTCQNSRFIDNSSNAFTVTANSSTTVESFDPFYTSTITGSSGSLYFDGGSFLSPANGQQLLSFGTRDFTIDLWVYLPFGITTYGAIIETRTTANLSSWLLGIWNTGGALRLDAIYAGGRLTASSTTIPVGAWTHITFSQTSGVTRFFVNGVADSNTVSFASWDSSSTTPAIGKSVDNYYFLGYMSGLRLVKGSGVSANFTPPAAPVNPTPSTSLLLNGTNAGAYDAASINDMTTIGNAQVSTAISKFGGSSVFFDGTNSILTTVKKVPCVSGTGNFTIEFWLYPSSIKLETLVSMLTTTTSVNPHIYMDASGYINYFTGGAVRISGSIQVTTGQWYHVAVTRSSGTTRLFINGVQSGSNYSDANDYVSPAYVNVGQYMNSDGVFYNSEWLAGYIDDLRITPGVARYTSNFTPPTQAFPTY